MGVAHGREIHGQPKKLGMPKLEARGDAWVGTVSRNGIDVITGTLAYKQNRGRLVLVVAVAGLQQQLQPQGGRPHRRDAGDPAAHGAPLGQCSGS
ncbi:hypothetical protein CNECB9_820005 [Cupriavidus necator]|uniref:Uncharacterized protein n=1 Tax=Cupriavidus necator TaxID=106590 RepID=A0A1K0ISQ9_CUPNE|nr:hypothetical protein CNECB9_820005 [Cupriavidus necator]